MKEPYWFSRVECLALHDALLAWYGGLPGLRSDHQLRSVLARPRQIFAYTEADIWQLAAAYAGGMVQGHPFVDGNKRTGFMLAAGFIERNGGRFQAAEPEVVTCTFALATGAMDELAYAAWLRSVG